MGFSDLWINLSNQNMMDFGENQMKSKIIFIKTGERKV